MNEMKVHARGAVEIWLVDNVLRLPEWQNNNINAFVVNPFKCCVHYINHSISFVT
jgi:hypothetical protein